MQDYPFINIDKSNVDVIKKHLKEQCGVEPAKDAKRDDLIEAVIVFEETNGLTRPVELLPESMRTTAIESATAKVDPNQKLVKLIAAHGKVRIVIRPNGEAQGQTQIYANVNEYDCIIRFDEECDVPGPLYLMLKDAKELRYEQQKDGTLKQAVVPSYNIEFIGQSEDLEPFEGEE